MSIECTMHDVERTMHDVERYNLGSSIMYLYL